MIIPCIDLMGGKVVQLVRGREKALEAESAQVMLEKFSAFPTIQVIDLDAATGAGSNEQMIEQVASRGGMRVGGGIRSVEKASRLAARGADKIIIGTSAFAGNGPNFEFLSALANAVARDRIIIALDSLGGRIVVKGWRESLDVSAEQIIERLEPFCGGFLCTYVDKEGMMQGTDLVWFARLRAATTHEITAAGGITTYADIAALQQMNVHAAVGMAVYTGRLDLARLARM